MQMSNFYLISTAKLQDRCPWSYEDEERSHDDGSACALRRVGASMSSLTPCGQDTGLSHSACIISCEVRASASGHPSTRKSKASVIRAIFSTIAMHAVLLSSR